MKSSASIPQSTEPVPVHVRGMVCARCVLVVRQLADATGVTVHGVSYGRVDFARALSVRENDDFAAALGSVGFGLIRDRDEVLAEAIEIGLRELAERTPSPTRGDLLRGLAETLDVPLEWAAEAFRRSRGETPGQRYTTLLMGRAARLVREGELQGAEIAHAVGYAHLSGFSRAFKRHYGASPTRYAAAAVSGGSPEQP